MSNYCATPKGTRISQKEYIESNKKVYRKRKRTKELLFAAFWKPEVPHHGFASRSWDLIGRQIYGNLLCFKRYKYPHRTYPSLPNEFKQSLFKHQSQERVKKIQKHVFNHYCSSHTLQRYYLFIFPDILCCCSCCFLVLVMQLFNGFLSISLFFSYAI